MITTTTVPLLESITGKVQTLQMLGVTFPGLVASKKV